MDDARLRAMSNEIGAVIDKIVPLLENLNMAVHGAVISELLARFLANFGGEGADKTRERAIELHVRTARILLSRHDEMSRQETGAGPN